MTALVPRKTVEAIVQQRNNALSLFGDAHTAMEQAAAAIAAANRAVKDAAPTQKNAFNYHLDKVKEHFLAAPDLLPRDAYLIRARKIADTEVWAHIVELTELERLMDKKAKDQLRQQLLTDPPEATVDNIYATLQQFMLDADTIWKRGIAECFSALDRRFRSHDGWKIGSRVILSYAFNNWGSWNYHSNQRDTLMDIERVFYVLDGRRMPPNYGSIAAAVEASRSVGMNPRQSYTESEFFRVRGFKNGNAHVWFRRDDLVEKVNKLLAEYYGAVIPEEREPDKDTGLYAPKTSIAKNYGFFPTPDVAADTLIEDVPLYRHEGEGRFTVLEPSAGTGNLARRAVRKGAIVDCVEIQPDLAEQLRATGLYRRVTQCDFLALKPDPANLYDRIVMNPPFDRERDIDHVMHALKFLKPEGFLAAIMSAGTEFRETRKSTAFREVMTKMNARWSDLPANSFSSVGTNVNTLTLRVWKSGRKFW